MLLAGNLAMAFSDDLDRALDCFAIADPRIVDLDVKVEVPLETMADDLQMESQSVSPVTEFRKPTTPTISPAETSGICWRWSA